MKGGKLNKRVNKLTDNFYYIFALMLGLVTFSCNTNKIYQTSRLTSNFQMLENLKLLSFNKGNLKIVIETQQAFYNTVDILHLKYPVIVFYKNGNYIATLTSVSIDINIRTYDFQSDGQCTLKVLDNIILTAKKLTYNAAKELVYSYSSIIRYIPNNVMIYGDSVQTDIQIKNLLIKGYKILIA
jgi:WD40 repeat protein